MVPEDIVDAFSDGDKAAVQAWLSGGGLVNATFESGIDEYGWTLLMNAAGSGHVELVDMLLRHGADVNQQNSAGVAQR